MFENTINIQGRSQQNLTAQVQVQLRPGVYSIWSTTDTYIKVDQTKADDVTTNTGLLIFANDMVSVQITSTSYLCSTAAAKYHQTG